MNFVIFLLNFYEILSEFRDEFWKIAKTLYVFIKMREILEKMLENSGIDAKVHSFSSLVQLYP